MTDFKDRERAEEAKFALDEETAFKIAARRNRLLGEWAAGVMNLTPEETEAYKKAVVQADFEEAGDEDVIRKLLGDLTAADSDVTEADIRAKLDEMALVARRQFMSDHEKIPVSSKEPAHAHGTSRHRSRHPRRPSRCGGGIARSGW